MQPGYVTQTLVPCLDVHNVQEEKNEEEEPEEEETPEEQEEEQPDEDEAPAVPQVKRLQLFCDQVLLHRMSVVCLAPGYSQPHGQQKEVHICK